MTVWSLFPRDSSYFGPGGQAVMVNSIVDESEYGRFGWATDAEGNRMELWEPPSAAGADEHLVLQGGYTTSLRGRVPPQPEQSTPRPDTAEQE